MKKTNKIVFWIIILLILGSLFFLKIKQENNNQNRYILLKIALTDSKFTQPLLASNTATIIVEPNRPSISKKYLLEVRESKKIFSRRFYEVSEGKNILPKGTLSPDKDYKITVRHKGISFLWTESEILEIHTPLLTVAAIGDSVTFGAGTKEKVDLPSPLNLYLGKDMTGKVVYASGSLSKKIGPTLIYNFGKSGISTNDDEFYQLVENVTGLGFVDVAYINIGVNDVRKPNLTPSLQYKKNIEKAANILTEKGIKVILSKPYDPQAKNGIWSSVDHNLMRQYSAELDRINMKDVTLDPLDYSEKFSNPLLLDDGVHPNKDGHIILGEGMAESIASLYYKK